MLQAARLKKAVEDGLTSTRGKKEEIEGLSKELGLTTKQVKVCLNQLLVLQFNTVYFFFNFVTCNTLSISQSFLSDAVSILCNSNKRRIRPRSNVPNLIKIVFILWNPSINDHHSRSSAPPYF